jgi:Carboxypeptidase regulatory-like domain
MGRRQRTGIASGAALAAAVLLASCSAATGAGSAGPTPTVTTSPAASAAPGSPSPGASAKAASGIRGKATAGPVCPVERVPPESACAPRPVIGAVVVVQDASGHEVGRATTDSDGTYLVALPTGTYTVEAEATTGIMRAPAPQSVTVGDGVAVVDLSYDTGIR